MLSIVSIEKGYTCYMNNNGHCIDIFFATDSKKKTNAFVTKCINALQNKLNCFTNISDNTIEFYKKELVPATLEIQKVVGGDYHGKYDACIYGDYFGGRGTEMFVDKENLFDYKNGGIIYIKLD